jgi:hypothetical protein
MVGFLFSGDTQETAESLKRKRAIAEALMENAVNDVPQNIGEGLSAVGQALAGRILTNRLEKKEKEGRAAATGLFNKAIAGFGGDDPAPGAMGSRMPSVTAGGDVPVAGSTDFDPASVAPETRAGIIETAAALGIDPVDLGTAISYETARTFDPTKKGPTTQWGTHRGYIQFGEPQAAENGVDWNNPIKSQLGADGAVAKYLRKAGVKPGMGLLDIYSAINAGGVGRYNASDANNGGAPGTVADKVNKQMAAHRQKALALLGDLSTERSAATAEDAFRTVMPELGGATIDDPMLVYDDKGARMEPASYARTERQNPYSGPGASIDTSGSAQAGGSAQPSAVVQALANADIPAEFQQSAQLRNAMGNGRGVIQALLEGTPATDAQLGQARVRGNAVQQALASPVRADNGLGIDPSVVDLMSDPYLSEGQRATLQTFIADKLAERKARREAELKRADPAYKVGLEKTQLELDNLRNPKISPADQARLDLDQRKFEAEQARGEWELKDGRMYNKRTGETKEIPGGRPPAAFKDVSSLRKEIQDLPSYKNLSQALPIYRSMYETAGRDTRASDLNLVYGLGKIMDPTSVVREGEMVMVKNTSSLPDWLQGAITSLNGGAALTPETRRALLTEAYGRVQGYDQAFQQDIGQYRGIVERNNMNMDDVIPSFGAYEPWAPAGGASTPAPEGVDQDVWDAMTPEERKLWQK